MLEFFSNALKLSHTYSSRVQLLYFFFNFGLILTGFSQEGRSWAIGDRKNTHVEKYTKGCHGNLKSLIKRQILPEKALITLDMLLFIISVRTPQSLCDSTIKALVYDNMRISTSSNNELKTYRIIANKRTFWKSRVIPSCIRAGALKGDNTVTHHFRMFISSCHYV